MHSGSGYSPSPAPERFMDTLPSTFLLPEVRISSETKFCAHLPHHKAANRIWIGCKTKIIQQNTPPQGFCTSRKFTFSLVNFPYEKIEDRDEKQLDRVQLN
ncbi:hypothetical protein FDW94_23455 [Citrobacter sp. wls757]|nr:hypothetical protein [Salmonella enterica]TKU36207.1 hypothetical protein FDW94_23455 [Citrobacter sp. wls757]